MDAKQVQAQWDSHDRHTAIALRQELAELGLYPELTAATFPLPEDKTAEDAREQLRAFIDVLDVADVIALRGVARLLYLSKPEAGESFVYDFIAHFAPKYTEAVA